MLALKETNLVNLFSMLIEIHNQNSVALDFSQEGV